MAATNINRVVLTGNLTRDPELRSLPSGMSVCSLRIASNTRRKNNSTGEWEDKPNYFDVTVWGAQGENCARFLSKGRPVALDGRLEWREWEAQDGNKRQSVEIIADAVQFLGGRDDGRAAAAAASRRAPTSRSTTSDFQPAGAPAGNGTRRRGGRRHPVLGRASPRRTRPRHPRAGVRAGARGRRLSASPLRCARAVRRAHSAARECATVFYRAEVFQQWRSSAAGRRAGVTRRAGPAAAAASPASTAATRSSTSTTRTSPPCGSSSPTAARSARAASRAPAAGTRTRSPRRSSARASSRCSRTSATAARTATSAAGRGRDDRDRDRDR